MSTKPSINVALPDIGDISEGRPNLGTSMPVSILRLFQAGYLAELPHRFGLEEARAIIRGSGVRVGRFCHSMAFPVRLTLEEALPVLPGFAESNGIGVMRMEAADFRTGILIFTVSEDLDCSGMSQTGTPYCVFDEGIFEGLFHALTGNPYKVREIDCWCTGARTCRFKAEPKHETGQEA